jgi:hypothetical protein
MMLGDYASSGDYISDWHYTLESLARLGGTTPLGLAIGNHDGGSLNGQNFADMFTYDYDNLTRGKYYAFSSQGCNASQRCNRRCSRSHPTSWRNRDPRP